MQQKYAVVMSKETYAGVPDLLRGHGIAVEPAGDLDQFTMLRCRRDGVAVLLSMTQPPHWASADDDRRDLVVLAALGESVLRFWRLGREHRLRRDVIDLLRPHAWQAPA